MLKLTSILFIALVLVSCGDDTTMPRPRDYFRIDLPPKAYQKYKSDCAFTFEYPVYSRIEEVKSTEGEQCRFNIDFASLHAKIHLTYKDVHQDLDKYLEDSRKLSYKHAVKASGIKEFVIDNPEKKVYGMIYEVDGNAASAIQFLLTDSTRHFLRGALYFYAPPNADSLAPVVSFVRQDIEHLVNSFEWK